MTNHNSAPYYPVPNQRYPPFIPRADIASPNFQPGQFHQTIPSLVFNHDPLTAPTLSNQNFHLLAHDPQAPKAEAPSSVPLMYNSLTQQRPFSQPNAFQIPPGPVPSGPGMYFMQPAPFYPHSRALSDERYMGTRPGFNDRFPAHLAKFSAEPGQAPGYPANFTPSQTIESYPPAPSHPMYENPPTAPSQGNRLVSVEDDIKNYKPTQTKKNSRPKINKIINNPKRTVKKKYEIGEHSNDSLFVKFLEELAIKSERTDLRKTYRVIIEDELEQKLFDLFVNQLSVFIDVFLPEKHFQEIISELALYDDTRLILDSIFCFSSLIFQRMKPAEIDPLCPLKYYQKVVNSIRYHLSLPNAEIPESGILARCLISTNILCIYELFFVAIDSTYVKGAGSILLSILSKWNKSDSLLRDSPLYNTCFWAMFVCDLILSLKLEVRSTYSLEKTWRALEPTFFETFETNPNGGNAHNDVGNAQLSQSSYLVSRKATTFWLRKIMMLLCDITEYLNACEVISREDFEANAKFEKWKILDSKLKEFEMNMPVYLKPLITKPIGPNRLFPLMYFRDEQTAIVTLNFKLAKLSLHVALCRNTLVQDMNLVKEEMANYPPDYQEKLSKDLVGIMCTYDSNQKIWPVNIHALRQASKYLEKDSAEYEALKQLVIRIADFIHAGSNVTSIVKNKHNSS